MSPSVPGVGTNAPIVAPHENAGVYAHGADSAGSTGTTTLGSEQGAAAVVYEPGPSQEQESLTYSHRNRQRKAAETQADSATGSSGRDDLEGYYALQAARLASAPKNEQVKIAEASGGTSLPPADLPDTQLSAAVKAQHKVWAPVKPLLTKLPPVWNLGRGPGVNPYRLD